MPIMPFAPARLSTSTVFPIPSFIFWASGRVSMSIGPPGGYGTTMRTGLAGNLPVEGACARASPPALPSASTTTIAGIGSRFLSLPERELLVATVRDLGGLAPVVDTITVVTQHATHAAAVHVAVYAGLPGIDLPGEEPLGRPDDGLRPLRHVLRPGLHARVVVLAH